MPGEYDNDKVVRDVLEELRALQGVARPMAGGVLGPGRTPLTYQEGVRNRLTDIGAGVEAGIQKVFPLPGPEQTRQADIIGERMNVQRLAERETAANRLKGIFGRKPTEVAAPAATPIPTKASISTAPVPTTAIPVAKSAGLVKPKDISGTTPSRKTIARPITPPVENIPRIIEPGVTSFGVTPPGSRPAPVRRDVAEGAAINETTRSEIMKENEVKRLDVTARLGEAVKQSEFVRSPEIAMKNKAAVTDLQRELFLLENQKRDLEAPFVAPTTEAPTDTGRRLMGPELVIDKGGVLREGRVSGVDEGDASEVEQIRGGIVSGGKTARGSEAGVLRQGLIQAIERGDMAGVEKLAKATQELETAALTREKIPHVKGTAEADIGLTKAQTGREAATAEKTRADIKREAAAVDMNNPKNRIALAEKYADETKEEVVIDGRVVERKSKDLQSGMRSLESAGYPPLEKKTSDGSIAVFMWDLKSKQFLWKKK